MPNFNIGELDTDTVSIFSKSPEDKFEKNNLLEIGLSEELASGLNGKTVGEFKEIFLKALNGNDNINAEMFIFGRELFASYHNTGYENKEINIAITNIEENIIIKDIRGLSYDCGRDPNVITSKDACSPLPRELQTKTPATATDKDNMPKRSSYFGITASPQN